MQFDLTADQRLFSSTTKSFLDSESPLTTVRENHDKGVSYDADFWRKGAELGWAAMLVPEELGGGGSEDSGLLEAAIVAEHLGRLVAGAPFLGVNVVASALASASNADAHSDSIEALVSGEATAAWAVYAPGKGWDPAGGSVTATRSGEGWTLSGVTDRVDSGDTVDLLLVLASTDEGLAQFLVPASATGVEVVPQTSIDMVRHFATVTFRDVAVPADAIVGAPGEAPAAVERQLQIAVVLQCAEMVGATSAVFEFTMQWLFDRYTFGRPLASYQALKHRVADMKLWLEASEATTTAACRAVQLGSPDAADLVSVAKAYVGEKSTDIVQDCIQLHGGIGVTWEHDLHLYLRRLTVDRVTWGTPSDHRRRIADLLEI